LRKSKGDRDRRHHCQRAEHREHAAPAQEIADQAGQGRAQQIAGHRARQGASDRDLALLGPDEVAGQPESDRKYAAGADSRQDAGGKQHRK
jgi:hypothetical protein